MKHKASVRFWRCYDELPVDLRETADKAFEIFKANPLHPSLHFKKIGKVWSARVGLHHRALATEIEDGYLWFWIGAHDEYERLLV